MRPGKRKVPTQFAGDTHFELPVPMARSCGVAEAELQQLKARVLVPWLAQAATEGWHERLHRAAAEAVSLAWATPFPLLVLPVLIEEKVHEARLQTECQLGIHENSQLLLVR